jgi:hypothetical protein
MIHEVIIAMSCKGLALTLLPIGERDHGGDKGGC